MVVEDVPILIVERVWVLILIFLFIIMTIQVYPKSQACIYLVQIFKPLIDCTSGEDDTMRLWLQSPNIAFPK